MAETILQLSASDFDEAIAHLSLVFGDPNFSELLPALYQPTDEHMRCNYAIRRDGTIVAIVGLFPISWVVGGERLKLAGVGGVSVHPSFRGHGYMRRLMDVVMDEIRRGGYHAACLGGNRRRYAYWGFEKAGIEASFLVTPNSLRHVGAQGAMHRESAALQPDQIAVGDLCQMRGLYEQQIIRCDRSAARFPQHLSHWRRSVRVTRNAHGEVIAYGCVDPKDFSCMDLCGADASAIESFLRESVLTTDCAMRVSMPMLHTSQFARLAAISDDVSLIEASNWRIYDWAAVLGALMRAKHSVQPMAPGKCVLQVAGCEESLRLEVDIGARCTRVSQQPDLVSEAGELLRMLAGPLPLTPRGGSQDWLRWRPLPLMIPMQDRI